MLNWFLDGSNAVTAAILAALITVAVQIHLNRKEERARYDERVRHQKMSVISDLVAYRYALTGGGKHTMQDVSNFNAALNRIPVEFIDYPQILSLYADLGSNFTSGKYYELINELVRATDPKRAPFTLKLLDSVPAASAVPVKVTLDGMQIQNIIDTAEEPNAG